MGASGDIMFGPWAVHFPVSLGQGCNIVPLVFSKSSFKDDFKDTKNSLESYVVVERRAIPYPHWGHQNQAFPLLISA